jgi:hypothetical protein
LLVRLEQLKLGGAGTTVGKLIGAGRMATNSLLSLVLFSKKSRSWEIRSSIPSLLLSSSGVTMIVGGIGAGACTAFGLLVSSSLLRIPTILLQLMSDGEISEKKNDKEY